MKIIRTYRCGHQYFVSATTPLGECQVCKTWKWANEARAAANTRGLPLLTGDDSLQLSLGYIVRDRIVRGLDKIKEGLLVEGPGMIPELQHVWSELVSYVEAIAQEATSAGHWRAWRRVQFFHLAYLWSTFVITHENEWSTLSVRAITSHVLDKQRLAETLSRLYPRMRGYSQQAAGILLSRINDWYAKFLLSDFYKAPLREKLGLAEKVK